MKTFQQRINQAKKKLMKFSTDIEGLVNKMSQLAEDTDDEEFADKLGGIMDILVGVIDVDTGSDANIPTMIEYLDELAEGGSYDDEENED